MVTNQSVSLEEAANIFLTAVPQDDRPRFGQEISRFLRWFGANHSVSSLTPPEIGNYAEQVARLGGDYTRKLEPIKTFLQYLKKQEITASNLSVHLKPPPPPAKSRKLRTHKTGTSTAKDTNVLTSEGFADLKSQLEELKKELPRLTEEITRAREDKDIRENAPLESAREAKALVESKILVLETTLKQAVIIEEREAGCSARAAIGNVICLKNVSTGDTAQYKLVDPNEADPSRGKISFISPLGKCILGKLAGEIVEVNAPIGVLRYRIETIGG
ncbi:MAG: GreA/GreB family elongation factor [Chloroflexi bacterium]|nr:GreA/GreB family elongation factor [Chloroflexota bacterium]